MTLEFHATASEIIQALCAAFGLLEASWALADTLKDTAALHASSTDPARRTLATSHVVWSVVIVVVMTLLAIIGASSLVLPPPPSTYEEGAQLLITRMNITALTMVLAGASLADLWLRRLFIRRVTWSGRPKPPTLVVDDPRKLRKDHGLVPAGPLRAGERPPSAGRERDVT